jgi:hypothetical protein
MKICIDCEWNSFGGELISMALVSEDGNEFYEVLGCDQPHEWVAKHVMPSLNKEPVPYGIFQHRFQIYLQQFATINIIADWPEDIIHFNKTLLTGPGQCMIVPPLTMRIMDIESDSLGPHNALEDARANMASVITMQYNRK